MRFTSIHVLIRVRTDFSSKIQDFFQNNNSFFQTQGYTYIHTYILYWLVPMGLFRVK